jgi:hypothetical protein
LKKTPSDGGGFYISNRKSFGAGASPRSLFVVICSDVQERVHVHSAALFRSLIFSAKYRLALLTLTLLALSALVQIPRKKVALGTTGEKSKKRSASNKTRADEPCAPSSASTGRGVRVQLSRKSSCRGGYMVRKREIIMSSM